MRLSFGNEGEDVKDELKPCPWCEGEAIGFVLTQGTKWGACLCNDCMAYGPEVRTYYKRTEWHIEAIKAWNTRPEPEAVKALEVDEAVPIECFYICEKCSTPIMQGDNYCPGCGKKIDWGDK